MKRLTTRLAPTVFLGAIAATGCVHISTTPLANSGPAISPDSVQVFATKTPTEYKELAVLRAKRFLVSDKKTLAALRKEAAEMGIVNLEHTFFVATDFVPTKQPDVCN